MKRYNFLYALLLLMHTFSIVLPQSAVGKTHFIMGEPTFSASVMPLPVCPPQGRQTPNVQILFTPDDNIRHHLLQLINGERHAIYCAVFMVTDTEVANALCAARKRGVRIELVTDVGCLKDRASKVMQLSKNDCAVYIYNPTSSAKGVSLMHNKFALFANNGNGPHTWTGSYNFTRAANNSNRENVVIFSDKHVFDTYFEQFKRLKSQSYQYTREKITVL
jgi:cardiolipin hydrolase